MTTFRRWFDAGFTDVIPVIPPGAPLSPNTRVRPADLGKVPGVKGPYGWHSFDWRSHAATPQDCGRWQVMGASLGLRGDRFPGVDIDITDPALADIVAQLALDTLGPAPCRTGRAPKRLLVYRLAGDEPIGLLRLWFRTPNGTDHLIEIRGAGQQYVCEGVHPATGQAYSWDERPAGPESLTAITRSQAMTFLEQAAEVLDMLGCERLEREDSTGAERAGVDQETLADDADAVAEAVALIPNDNETFPGRVDYIRMGCAIKAALPDDPDRAREIWLDWALRWDGNDRCPHGNDYEVAEADWERMRPPYAVGAPFIFDLAREHGFNQAATEFSVIQEEVPGPSNRFAPIPKTLPEDFDPKKIPTRPWVLGTRFMRGAVTGGIGAPGVSKSTLSLISALAVATGRKDLTGEAVHIPGPVWVHNNEDDEQEMERRLGGMCIRYGIDFALIRPRLHYSSGAVRRLVVAAKQGDQVKATEAVQEMIATIRALGIVFLAADPFVSTHNGVAENSNEEIERVINCFRVIAQQTGCAIDLVHHAVKNHSGNTEARAGDMNAARGASAFIGAIRIAYTLAPMGEETAEKLGIAPERAARLVRMDHAKGNYSARVWEPIWFELTSQDIGNGPQDLADLDKPSDSVGVPVLFDMGAARREADARDDDRRAAAAGADVAAIAETMPEDGCLLSDVLPALVARWGVKDRQARERVHAAVPLGATVTANGWVVSSAKVGRGEKAPIELRRRAVA
ncbi:AAA family ATPase [Azospirillum argentinense]|uniref:DNA primase/polymerase bifunctional N-terminal domain-containing protein n=1 Tax=Azospirillum brasilense TaxID=192 RepID=A0A4D8Q4D7_AZOBR|nr:AAA family ATPase [Azospirillum argentinense]QCO05457.1 hypothetical protein D3867_26290 [Azospirillum argentinense]